MVPAALRESWLGKAETTSNKMSRDGSRRKAAAAAAAANVHRHPDQRVHVCCVSGRNSLSYTDLPAILANAGAYCGRSAQRLN